MMRRWLRAAVAIAAAWVFWTAFQYYAGGPRHRAESAWFVFTALALAAIAANPRGASPLRRPERPESAERRTLAVLLVAVAASVALYWPAISVGLLSDDYVLLARPVRAALDPFAWEHFRPLPLLAWKALEFFGDPAAFHVLNVTLHGLNAWLLWRLSVRLGHTPQVAALVAAVFLFFPAAVEPVTWISGLFDVATVSFGLLYVHGAISLSRRAQTLGLVALACALLSKETAVVLPAIGVAVALRIRTNRATLAISCAMAGAYAVTRVLGGADVRDALLPAGRPMRYALKEFFVRPFASLGSPWTPADLRPVEDMISLGLVPLVVLLALIVAYVFRRAPPARALTGPSWVLLSIVPLAGFFFVSPELEGSRYLYLPLCGWSLFLGDLVSAIGPRRVEVAVAATLVAAVVGVGSWGVRRHLRPWQEAALLRDRVLAEARVALLKTRCVKATFENVPDVHDGAAQVFRNGLNEAVRDMEYRWEGADCRFAWTGRQFVQR